MFSDEAILLEIDGKKYAFLNLCTFRDIDNKTLESNFGLIDIIKTKSVYEIKDEKKYMLAKIKYGI